MYLILAAIIVSALIAAFLILYGEDTNYAAAICGFFLAVATGISAVFYSFMIWSWIASDHRAQIINREYGTAYTQEEVFYASNVIETIRQLDRKRYEINGDIMRDKK